MRRLVWSGLLTRRVMGEMMGWRIVRLGWERGVVLDVEGSWVGTLKWDGVGGWKWEVDRWMDGIVILLGARELLG